MPRLDYFARAEYAMTPLQAVEAALERSTLGKNLISLIKMRASQINRCGYCLNMHTQEALRAGESLERLTLLPAFEESPLFDERERAMLSYVEHATELSERGVPDAVYTRLSAQLTTQEVVDLTVATGMINLWNRLSVTMGTEHPVNQHRLATLVS